MPDEFYTVEEIQTCLKVSRQTVYNWIKSGDLPAMKFGRQIRITRAALLAFAKQIGADDSLLDDKPGGAS